jgi:hypothetical protein
MVLRQRKSKGGMPSGQRHLATTSRTRLRLQRLRTLVPIQASLAGVFLALHQRGHPRAGQAVRPLLLALLGSLGEYLSLQYYVVPPPSPSLPMQRMSLSAPLPDATVFLLTGFMTANDLGRVFAALWPPPLPQLVGGRNLPLLTLFVGFLIRYRSGADFSYLSNMFGGDARRWSDGVTYINTYLYEQFSRALSHRSTLQRFAGRVANYNDAINAKLRGLGFVPDGGEATTIGFIDGMMVRTARPSDSFTQAACYSGYLRGHGAKALAAVAPDGLTLFSINASVRSPDGVVTNRHDVSGMVDALSASVGQTA